MEIRHKFCTYQELADAVGCSYQQIAKMFNVSKGTITNIRKEQYEGRN